MNNEYWDKLDGTVVWRLHEEIVCALAANLYMHYTCGSNPLYLEG